MAPGPQGQVARWEASAKTGSGPGAESGGGERQPLFGTWDLGGVNATFRPVICQLLARLAKLKLSYGNTTFRLCMLCK